MQAIVLWAGLLLGVQEKKLPVPDPAAQKAAEKLIRDVFNDDYSKKSPADRLRLAKNLLEQGLKTNDDPAAGFVLFREARDVAAQAGDLETAMKAVEEMARRYEVDGSSSKAAIYAAMSKNLKTPEETLALARSYLKLVDEAIAEEQFDIADKAAIESSTLAKKVKDVPLAVKADAKRKEVFDRKIRSERLKRARETLEKTPDDPQANLALGQYDCLTRGAWDTGLRMLVKGSDAALKELATRDLAGPKIPGDQALVGDGWWDLAEKESNPPSKVNLRARALRWYEEAAVGATGLQKVKIEKRLAELRLDRFRGSWTDLTDPRIFGLPGKAGDPITLATTGTSSKSAVLDKFPPGDFDGVTVRVRFGAERVATGMLCFEGNKRCTYIDSRSGSALVCHLEPNNSGYVQDKVVTLAKKEEYTLTVLLDQGEYIIYADSKEVDRMKTSFSRLISIVLQADYGSATFDQIKLRKKE